MAPYAIYGTLNLRFFLSCFSKGKQTLERSVLCILTYCHSICILFFTYLIFYYIVISFILPIFFLYAENLYPFFKVVSSSGDAHTALLVAGGVFHYL